MRGTYFGAALECGVRSLAEVAAVMAAPKVIKSSKEREGELQTRRLPWVQRVVKAGARSYDASQVLCFFFPASAQGGYPGGKIAKRRSCQGSSGSMEFKSGWFNCVRLLLLR